MPNAYTVCCDKLSAEITKANGIVAELKREANNPRPGNARGIWLLNKLRQFHQVGSDDLQRLRELSRGVGGNLAVIQIAEAALQNVNSAIPYFAAKFEGNR